MAGFWGLSPIRFLDFYLVLLFLAVVVRRLDLYRSIIGIVFRVPGRWPNLFRLLKEHRTILLTFRTLLPAFLIFGLSLVQLTASRLVWPEAAQPPTGLTVGRLAEYWWAVAVVVPLFLAMISLDLYGLIVVGQIDQPLLEKYFDQAEYWLSSRTARVVRFFTLGYINPRRMVSQEVEKALVEATKQFNTTMWWTVTQMSLRIAFGLSLWLTWAITLPDFVP